MLSQNWLRSVPEQTGFGSVVCMFSLFLCGFPPGTTVQRHASKGVRLIGYYDCLAICWRSFCWVLAAVILFLLAQELIPVLLMG